MSTLDWIAANLGGWVHVLPWTWPIAETIHFFGLCLLIGSLIVIDLRLLGINRLLPAVSVDDLLPIAYVGFGLNLATGILFYVGDPHRYTPNIAFQLKMLLIFLAGLNALYYQIKIHPNMAILNGSAAMPTNVKVVGATSLVLWFGVLAYGRRIAYIGTG
ncbi:MAG: DUF6644 family protein [Candidatus Rariloculaceae bacterium]